MKNPREIDEFYNSRLRPVLRRLERQRVTNLILICAYPIYTVALLCLLPLLFHYYDYGPSWFRYLIPIIFLCAALSYWPIELLGGSLRPDFKEHVIAPLIRFYSPDLSYNPIGSVPFDALRESKLVPGHVDIMEGEDLVSGEVNGVKIAFSELQAMRKLDEDKPIPIFHGFFFVAEFTKDFAGVTVSYPSLTARRLIGVFARAGLGREGMGSLMQVGDKPHGTERVTLESPEFEKAFSTYSTDQIEARYILTPSLMDRMLEFRRKADVPVGISFVHSKVFIAFQTRGKMFEPPFFQSLLRPEVAKRCLRELELAIGIVNDLKLNTRIWSKG